MLGKVVHDEYSRAVDLNFRMHQALAVLGRHPDGFGRAERLLVEFERGVGVADDEMGGDDLDGRTWLHS